jgi:hypothetical protein
MPNTLAHIGVQAIATRSIIKDGDYKWIFIGCIIPDIPWILQRPVSLLFNINPYDLRLYAIVQASFFFCLILSLSLSTFSKNYWKTFAILIINSLVHLLLDALQVKWGTGVHLFVPFSWQMVNFHIFWPESIPNILISLLGLGVAIYAWSKVRLSPNDLVWPKKSNRVIFILSLLSYIAMPLVILSAPENANNHFIKTLRQSGNRQGKLVEIDRGISYLKNGNCMIKTFAGEELFVKGQDNNCSGRNSVRATFINQKTIRLVNKHRHWGNLRDIFSYIGLLFIALYWIRYLKMVFFSKNIVN